MGGGVSLTGAYWLHLWKRKDVKVWGYKCRPARSYAGGEHVGRPSECFYFPGEVRIKVTTRVRMKEV